MIGSRFGGVALAGDLGRDPVAVALVLQLAVELGDQQAPVGEDQDADRACGLDETGGGDRLPRRGRVAEAVTADGARVALRRELVGRVELLEGLVHGVVSVVAVLAVLAVLLVVVVLVLRLVGDRPRAGAARPRSARSTSRRARPPGGGAAPFRTSGAAASRSAPARVRASARSGSSIRATAPAAPASISDRASSSARRRAVPGASTWPGSSSGWRNGSPAHAAARSAEATSEPVASGAVKT